MLWMWQYSYLRCTDNFFYVFWLLPTVIPLESHEIQSSKNGVAEKIGTGKFWVSDINFLAVLSPPYFISPLFFYQHHPASPYFRGMYIFMAPLGPFSSPSFGQTLQNTSWIFLLCCASSIRASNFRHLKNISFSFLKFPHTRRTSY